MADVTLVPIERLELRFARTSWPFAAARRDEIDRYVAELRRGKPELWNGRVLVLQTFAVADGVFRAPYIIRFPNSPRITHRARYSIRAAK